MRAEIESERRGELLVVRLKGTVGFAGPAFEMRDELVALLGEHVSTGVTCVLVDLSRTSFAYPSSCDLAVGPFLQRDALGDVRIAAYFKVNSAADARLRLMHLDRVLDCFDGEAEAIAFLQGSARSP